MPDSNHDLDEFIQRSTQVEVPADVEERLRGRLAEFRTRVEQRPPSRLRMLVYSLTHPPTFRVPAVTAAVLAAVAVALVIIPKGSNESRAYAAAAAQLRSAQSLEYTIVLAPYTEVGFTYLAPGYRRVNCSWGIEMRTDGSGKQLLLMHATQNYVIEQVKQVNDLASGTDMVEQFKSLPQTADESLGEQRAGGKRLIGYRAHHMRAGSVSSGFKALDLWVDAGTRKPDHVDITFQEPGKPLYQMHIKDIRVDAETNRSLFDMTPPAGYTALVTPSAEQHANQLGSWQNSLRPEIKQVDALTAVVVSMKGSYLQTEAAVQAVESHLKEMGVTPVGPPFGRYESEQHWDAGYPVPPGTRVEAPFDSISLPAASVASVVVNGPWNQDSTDRWTAFLRWVVEQGYVPAGPPMEIWSGDAQQQTQSTEMRIAVIKANGTGNRN
jgi:outer membrane lipoprotein-sorting protein/predicted transcriptional regulator YdeE